jgi:hypothetical protein
MKGFAGIILVLAIFVAAILLLSTSNQTKEDYSIKETFAETSLMLTNYEFILTQMAQDCDTPTIPLSDCVDSNATMLLDAMPETYITCTKINSARLVAGETNAAYFNLSCTAQIKKQNDLLLNMTIEKKIIIRKNN